MKQLTPAEVKANEILESFKPLVYCYMGSGMLSDDYDENVALSNAKQCALIHVDGIIETLNEFKASMFYKKEIEKWQEVRNAITNMKP